MFQRCIGLVGDNYCLKRHATCTVNSEWTFRSEKWQLMSVLSAFPRKNRCHNWNITPSRQKGFMSRLQLKVWKVGLEVNWLWWKAGEHARENRMCDMHSGWQPIHFTLINTTLVEITVLLRSGNELNLLRLDKSSSDKWTENPTDKGRYSIV